MSETPEVNMNQGAGQTNQAVIETGTENNTNQGAQPMEQQASQTSTVARRTREEYEEHVFEHHTCKICFCKFDWAMHWKVAFGGCRHCVCVICLLDLFGNQMPCPFCRRPIATNNIRFMQRVFHWPEEPQEVRAIREQLYETQVALTNRRMRNARLMAEENQAENQGT